MFATWSIGAGLVLVTVVGAVDDPSDRELERIWKGLSAEERAEALDWYRFELSELDTLQLRLVRRLSEGESSDLASWEVASPPPFFDESEYAGKRKSRRKWLSPSNSKVRSAHRKHLATSDEDPRAPLWSYDWGRGVVVAAARSIDEERQFRDALAGIPPGLDLARALCLRALDDGAQRRAHTAFAHAYVDRRGNVYPGLTLYDVWASGERFEVPDADAIGLVSTALGTRSGWSAPLSSNEQRAIYQRIGEVFADARRHRELRESLADVLLGDPPARSGYEPARLGLHALWVRSGEDPTALARMLPDAAGWQRFMEQLPADVEADEETKLAARTRWGQLIADGARVRATLVHVLRGMRGTEEE